MKRTALIISVLSLIIISTDAFASKLVWMKAIDKDYLMFYFYDGDVCFPEDLSTMGTNKYTNNWYTGCNVKVAYGNPLNTTNAVNTANWSITSADDANYGTDGNHPTNCYRKSKMNAMSQDRWGTSDWIDSNTMEHTIYLKLPVSLTQGSTYTIQISNTNSDTTNKTFTYDIFNSPSEAVHVNLVGYLNDSSVKACDLYIWMGNGGARDYSGFVGNKVYIYDVCTSAAQQVGTVAFWKNSAVDLGNYNLTMSNVWKADFTGFNTPGTYRIAIDGVGCSENFEVKKDAYFEPFRVSTIGYFYMRIG
jgi:hypothetical protein